MAVTRPCHYLAGEARRKLRAFFHMEGRVGWRNIYPVKRRQVVVESSVRARPMIPEEIEEMREWARRRTQPTEGIDADV